jgi:uncharacterized RDD family membrane protein YckC
MGHFLIVLRPDRRALHDILAGTWVVRRTHPRGSDETAEDEDPAEPPIQ